MTTWRNIILFLTGILATLLAGEVFIRLAGIHDCSYTTYHPLTGKVHRPNRNAIFYNEGFSIIHFNKIGLPSTFVGKESDTLKLALIGDSYIEGFQVFQRQHFAQEMGQQLNKKLLGKKLAILNFGRSNFDLANMYAYKKLLVDQYKPTCSLLFLSADDLTPELFDPLLPQTTLSNDSLVLKTHTTTEEVSLFLRGNNLLKKSALLSLINSARHIIQVRGLQAFFHYNHDLKPDEKSPKHLSQITIKILENLNPNQTILVWRETKSPPSCLINWVEQNQFPFINLAPLLQQREANGLLPNYWPVTKQHGHWNAETHQAMANYLADNHTIIKMLNQTEQPHREDNATIQQALTPKKHEP